MPERIVIFCRAVLVGLLLLAGGSVHAQELDPFRAPNLSPPIAIIGLPLWSDVPDSTAFGFTTEFANHYRLSRRLDDQLILDGETMRIRGYLEQPFGDGWALGIDVPYYSQSGGFLDDVVDGWHSAFNLPDGNRNARPEGLIEFDLSDAAGSFFSLSRSDSGLGDIQLSVARRIGNRTGTVLRAAVKLPTGDEDLLAGSGKTDWIVSALSLHESEVRGRAAGFFYGGALIEFGQPQNVQFPVEDRSLAAVAGGALAIRQRFGIKAQMDINSALYDSQLEEIGQTGVQVTIGGWLRFGESGIFEYAISEDLHVSTTPDVVLFLNLGWRLP